MDHHSESHQQREERLAAAKSFQEALDQLNDTFQESGEPQSKRERQPTKPQSSNRKSSPPPKFDLASLEDAVADIEEYMKSRQTYLLTSDSESSSDPDPEDAP